MDGKKYRGKKLHQAGGRDNFLLASHPLKEIRARIFELGLRAMADELRCPPENLKAHIERRELAEEGGGHGREKRRRRIAGVS